MTGDASTDPVRDAPPWRVVDLPGLGPIEVRDSGPTTGARDQPTIMLLHGWTTSADLNWCRSYGPLAGWRGGRTRLVTWDHRGHGGGTPGGSATAGPVVRQVPATLYSTNGRGRKRGPGCFPGC